MSLREKIAEIVKSFYFSIFINVVILVNSILIGIETFHNTPTVIMIQKIILGIFVLEIIVRWIGKDSVKEYFTNSWNIFDIVIVSVSFIPESLISNGAAISVLRIMRIFRVLRLIKTLPELKVIMQVLIKSVRSLGYTAMLFGIFMYMYGVMGVVLFRLPPEMLAAGALDPYGTLSESFFTLFRILTGEDWTDLRYDLLGKLAHTPDWIVTTYHVSWMALSAFLLINLIVGAVVNNYDQVMEENKLEQQKRINEKKGIEHPEDEMAVLTLKIDHLTNQINHLMNIQGKILQEKQLEEAKF